MLKKNPFKCIFLFFFSVSVKCLFYFSWIVKGPFFYSWNVIYTPLTWLVGQKGNNKISKCKLKKYLFGNKTKESGTDFRSDVTSRDFANWGSSIKTNCMCSRTELKVMLKISHNDELLCGAWSLKSFEQREEQRILSYSRNRVEIEAQKSKLWSSNVERLGPPVLAEKIWLLNFQLTTEFYRVCGEHFISGM